MNRKVAIVGSGTEWSGLPVVRELGKTGLEIFVLFQTRNTPVYYSKYLNGGFAKLPVNLDNKIVTLISDYCKDHEIDYIICLSEEIKRLLIFSSEKIKGIKHAFPKPLAYDTALQKSKSASFVKDLGVPTPKTYIVKSKSDLRKIKHDFREPLVVKGTRGDSSSHVRYAYSSNELEKHFNEICNIEKSISSAEDYPIIQEFIGGPTYLTQSISQHGKVKAIIPHLKLREWPVTGGVTTLGVTISEPKLVAHTRKIMEALGWHGEAGMEWKYNPKIDDFYFIEMNPRFEGSVDLAIKSGVNLPLILMDIIKNNTVDAIPEHSVNIFYRWFFQLDFRFFVNKPYGMMKFILESLNPNINGEIEIDDLNVLRDLYKKPIYEIINRMRKE